MNFSELGLIAPILSALEAQGYTQPTPIQSKAITPAIQGRDVLGCAQTGTGKTCAFSTPILQRLTETPATTKGAIRALIMTPTRELALQIQENIEAYSVNLPLKSAVIFGGVGQQPQVDKIKRGLDILVATPGRLLDLQNQKLLDLSKVEIFVLDEADRMLDMGFVHDVKKVLKVLPKQKQTLFFSATMPPEVMDLVNGLLQNPVKVEVTPVSSTVEVIVQKLFMVDKGNKTKLLASLINEYSAASTLVFTRTKHGANKVAADLEKAGISAAAIHGNKSQTARQNALTNFKNGKLKALVATDIAARGIDIEELPLVINYNLPEVPETYVHRIGRTGRAGHEGTALSFCDFGEKEYLRAIEKLTKKKLEVVEHEFPMEVFSVTKDSRGRITNSDDAEARQAARERRAARQAQGGGQSRNNNGNNGGNNNRNRNNNQKNDGPRQRNNPLATDQVMDATARFLAPKPKAEGSQGRSQGGRNGQTKPNSRNSKPNGNRNGDNRNGNGQNRGNGQSQNGNRTGNSQNRNGGQNGNRNGAPSRNGGPNGNRNGNRGKGNFRGGRPMPVTLRTDGVKDSTEQPSLMKPYYMND